MRIMKYFIVIISDTKCFMKRFLVTLIVLISVVHNTDHGPATRAVATLYNRIMSRQHADNLIHFYLPRLTINLTA